LSVAQVVVQGSQRRNVGIHKQPCTAHAVSLSMRLQSDDVTSGRRQLGVVMVFHAHCARRQSLEDVCLAQGRESNWQRGDSQRQLEVRSQTSAVARRGQFSGARQAPVSAL
jgi:hypothetical protein